jgi:phenylacetate-CoA ligase
MTQDVYGDVYGAALGTLFCPAWERLRGRPTFPLLAELRRTERASLDELDALRAASLRRLVRHAQANTAYYRKTLAGIDPDSFRTAADITRLPLLERTIAQATVDERTASCPAVAHRKTTSGSTGQPLEVRYCSESRHWRDATRWRGFGWGGYHMGDKAMHLWGVSAAPPTGWQKMKIDLDRLLRRDVYVNCMVRSQENLGRMVETLRRERPRVMMGYGQALADLARYINAGGLRDWNTIPVIYGAERLWPGDRDDLTKAFGPAVFETYGCREFMLMGSECEAHEGLHEQAENVIVEILVPEADGTMRPARPGEQGAVAVTDLHNLACPFIRYLIGDYATAREPSQCSCGRTLPRFGPIEGRVTDTMRDGEGNPVEGILFNILFLNLHNHARQFQVVQHPDRSLTVRIVPCVAGKLPRDAEGLIRRFVQEHMRGVNLRIQLVNELPLTKAGKLRRVVVEQPTPIELRKAGVGEGRRTFGQPTLSGAGGSVHG